jgi:hypothetical protein
MKWAYSKSADPESGLTVRLFHPRLDRWSDHFRWSPSNPTILLGLTPCGRATIERLQMNHRNLILARVLLRTLGLFPGEEP